MHLHTNDCKNMNKNDNIYGWKQRTNSSFQIGCLFVLSEKFIPQPFQLLGGFFGSGLYITALLYLTEMANDW